MRGRPISARRSACRFISIIDVTVEAVADLRPEAVGVLAVDACLSANLYQDALKKAGVKRACF